MHVPALLIALSLLAAASASARPDALVDPRAGGLTVAMGEWTLVPEAMAIRPGQVSFVVTNRGRYAHGFRIRSNVEGQRGKDRFEARTKLLQPGQQARLTVDLVAGPYEIACFVEDAHGDHADLGMRAPLDVRADAPFVNPKPARAANQIEISSFSYKPATLRVKAGTTVRWVNRDPAKHTVSGRGGAFTSSPLAYGRAYSHKFANAGSVVYVCAIHPSMQGRVVVTR